MPMDLVSAVFRGFEYNRAI